MAFEGLSNRLQEITRKMRGKARITESDLKEMLREVKLALLEADVNYKIVKEFISTIQEKALGQDVLKSLTPGQQVVKIVKDELVELLGGVESKVNFTPNPPTIIMLIGLQGAGKTTTAGKLANLFRKQGKKPLLVACDVYRPAAIKQLQVVGAQLNIPVFSNEQSKDVVHIARQAINIAISKLNDVIILDTAGRLQIDEQLMQELKNVKTAVKPHEILLVVDAMTGQEAVNVADTFNKEVGIDGIVLTKLDGDTRGGAALSVKKVTGKPIKFAATGEKLSDIEVFHPDRMAQRILGMGDILSVIEKAEETFDMEQAEKLEKQMRKREFDLDDYLAQLRQVKKMGSFSSLLKMIPGMNQLKDVKVDDKEFEKIEAMICSMTKQEKRNVKILNGSRRQRIAKGSGTSVQEVNKFIKSFEMTQKMMKQLKNNKGTMATKKFKCKVCGYVHEGDAAPEKCPVCQAPASEFEEIVEAGETDKPAKKGLNTDGNTYTIIYSCVVVVIVAFLLAFVSKALEPQSMANVRIDKKSQILAALNLRDVEKAEVEKTYDEVVVADEIIDKDGNVVKDGTSKDADGFAVEDKNISDSNLPLYVCKVNGETKYVIPVTGKGLWDAIWGYVALNADKNTIYGVYFTHKGETAGLGAIITEYDKFQKQFEGKKLMNDDKSAVAISVVKKGKVVNGLSDDSRCDAITGATLTSDGVNNMLHDCISRYMTFLNTNE